MRKHLLEFIVAAALTLGAAIAPATGAGATGIMVSKSFARASATSVAKVGAAYITLMNHGAEADRLIAITTSAAASAALHESKLQGDIMRMEPVAALDLPPNATVEMKPSGLHVMLMGLVKPLKEGETISVTLTFERAEPLIVAVPIGSAAATGD